MSKQLTLALLGFNRKQQAAFSAILVLSEMSLDDNWQIVDTETARVIFINSDQAISQQQWDEIQRSYPEAILVAYSENLASLNTAWALLTESTKPPQRSLLILLLNKLVVALNQMTKVVEQEVIAIETVDKNLSSKENSPKELSVNNPVAMIEVLDKKSIDKVVPPKKIPLKDKQVNDKYFLPEHYFLGIVQKSIQTGKIYHCKTQCNINIYLFPQQNCYFCSLSITHLSPLFLSFVDEIEIKEISETTLFEAVENKESKDINDLLWYSTTIASQGRLMKNRHRNDVVHLKYWPDISYINASESYLVIATFMLYNRIDIKRIAGYTEQKMEDVIDFYNACHSLGIISYNTDFVLNSNPASDVLRQLRRRVFKIFKIYN